MLITSLSCLLMASGLSAKTTIPNDNLDTFLKEMESTIPGVMDGAQKYIRWIDEPDQASDFVVLYFHGYSSSRQEIDPVPPLVADALQANLFYTRFTGHGIKNGGIAFKGVTFDDWIADAEEAMEIARIIGKRVVILAHSNGAVMAMHLMKQYPEEIVAGLFVAPNFKPKNAAAGLLTTNWGYKLGTMIYKDSLYSMSDSKDYQIPAGLFPYVWSKSQHLDATRALAIGVKQLQSHPFTQMRVPLFIVASEHDQVVSTAHTKKIFAKYGIDHRTLKELHLENHTNTHGEHTITGYYKAPATSQAFADAMIAFIHRATSTTATHE
ncbi:alpha/beta fold hydrolase [Entomospira entomophila]|uniref:Alpha/beta hydrolase n=1 Tax=Entomospira entomophila TaxID=2719988 RepID=A0A968G8U5_9SPIO|nr:alpha/beta fold hydrolase [Entomospira entomophilus]NIZ40057.1 alpha/beta hydrolase [Entomospira entomophilus]WDI35618.1 alpha/beta fold hydrolase [Entomospira entomophilus]